MRFSLDLCFLALYWKIYKQESPLFFRSIVCCLEHPSSVGRDLQARVAMDLFIQPIIEMIKCISGPVARRINYVRNLTKNFNELKDKAAELFTKRDDIKDRVDQQKIEKAPTKECERWLEKVGEIENNLKIIEEEYNAEKKWLKGWCPDICSRLKLGERVVDMINNVKDTYEKSKFEGGFVADLPLEKVVEELVPSLTAKAAADRTLKKVMDCIGDKKTQKIGIWGMGGVGKTTVMKLLNNTLEITTMFDVVIWVTVSKSWSIRKLQDEIAERLSIKITKVSDSGAARKLFQVLKGKKYLLLLDDVWEMVELNDIGIPNTSQDNGCKVILTTRVLDVCREMGTDVEIKVEELSKEEAWEMFHLEVGEVVVFPAIKPLAEDIVKKCDGLPLALKVVGRVLRKREKVDFWSDFLRDLKSPTTSFVDAVDEKVFKPLKVSYDHLKDTNKKCFLYCGLYPEDYEIGKSELIRYWIAEGFLSGKLTFAEARVKGDVILEALIDSSLLERCEEDEYVKVHDVIRDLILRLTSPNGEESTYLVRAGANKSKELLEDMKWSSATRMSYMCNNQLHSLPKSFRSPKLLTLLLQRNKELRVIPEYFFNYMPYLQVLDLSYTRISSLPTSISNLVSLRALFLRKCYDLKALPEEVIALKGLEVLCVTRSQMECIPSRIWELNNLKCLKFSSLNFTGEKKAVISSGMISRLSLLEELSILGRWFCLLSDESVDTVTKELSNMTRLSSLEFEFRRVDNLQHFIQNSKPWRDGNLEKFLFLVGISSRNYESVEIFRGQKRCLFYDGGGEGGARDGDGSNIIPPAIMEVLARSYAFYLRNHYGELKNLSDLDTRGLKKCGVERCGAIETIMGSSGDGVEVPDAFPNLEILKLRDLPNLKCIMEGLPMQPRKSFTSLKELSLTGCGRIKKVFSWGLIRQLHNLERIWIDKCPELEEVISVEGNDCEMHEYREVLPKLRFFCCYDLQNFVSFFGGISLSLPSLIKVHFFSCPKLKRISFGVDNAPNLRQIYGSKQWWEALEWEDDAIKSRLDPLFNGFFD
ncbi:hypothetical protein F0562_032687 [Nyssa sinensis]|uniref:AAA+ ATPase domain-containing protein n=1 Tax=Nyssa sinensis TaxID=561372 RepID=A0A5J5AQN9_9ASTE|nr:hypothetical protein F0562_032687 [Nyssa sinensis]